MFQDDDGSAFLLSASEMNAVMHVTRLSPDYLTVEGPFVRRLIGKSREAPAVFKYNQVRLLRLALPSGLVLFKQEAFCSALRSYGQKLICSGRGSWKCLFRIALMLCAASWRACSSRFSGNFPHLSSP